MPMTISKREAACVAGAITYTGGACGKCDGRLRYASNGACVECTRGLTRSTYVHLRKLRDAAKRKRAAK